MEKNKMELTKLHNPKNGQMQVAGLMSGSGSNIRKILELEKQLMAQPEGSPFHMAVLFSDCIDSNASAIGKEFNLPVIIRDIKGFYAAKGKPRRDLEVRAEFDAETVKALSPYNAEVAVYGGYMSIATAPLINAFLGINVHPADLSIMEGNKRKYTGDNAVRDAILAGEKYIYSTTHIIDKHVDNGKILMISSPLEVILGENFNPENRISLNETAKQNQERLKVSGDWIVFPRTILYIAQGRYSRNAFGDVYFDDKLIACGVRLGETNDK